MNSKLLYLFFILIAPLASSAAYGGTCDEAMLAHAQAYYDKGDHCSALAIYTIEAPHCPTAQYALGEMFRDGICVNNPAIAYELFSSAAAEGNKDATYSLCASYFYEVVTLGTCTTAIESCQTLANEGDPRANHILGGIYYSGACGKSDHGKAREFFLAAAEAGVPKSMGYLAQLYLLGWGGDRDYKSAYHWANKAASNGDARGKYLLAVMFHDGVCVEKDLDMANRYLRESADAGFTQALKRLHELNKQ